MVFTTQTQPQMKSQEFISNIKQHFMTSALTYGIQDCKMLCQKLGAPRPST